MAKSKQGADSLPTAPEKASIVSGYSKPYAASNDMVNCNIVHRDLGEIPYTLNPFSDDEVSIAVMDLMINDGVKFDELDECPSVKAFAELDGRLWRNTELGAADTIINKIEDFEIEGDSKAWRKYRVELRKWPEHKDFPSEDSKPKAPKLN